MPISFLDPRAEPAMADRKYELSLQVPEQGQGLTIGLLANGFPDSVEFLQTVDEALNRRLPKVRTAAFDKGNASITAPAELIDRISKECSAVIAAYGH